MKILVVNAGSSSLKYQLIEMTDEKVIAKGNCERIGIDGHIKHTAHTGKVYEADCTFPTHTEAFEKVVEVLTTGDAAVIKSMDEIAAVLIYHRLQPWLTNILSSKKKVRAKLREPEFVH